MKKHILYLLIFTAGILLHGCSKSSDVSSSSSGNSTGGSMARFTLVGNYLYTINSQNLKTFNVTNPASPVLESIVSVGPNIETIFPFKGSLYIGSSTAVYLYNLTNPARPERSSSASYIIRSKDPVVANDSIAYSATRNPAISNSNLNVIDIKNPKAISIRTTINFNDALYGLGIADSALYLCKYSNGLQVFSIKDILAYNPTSRKQINDGETYYDVITSGNLLYTWIEGGNSIFNINNRMSPVLLSKTKN